MPLVEVKVIEGVFTESQKHSMIEKITDVMVEIEGENLRNYTTVIVEEVKSGAWGIGGHLLSTDEVTSMSGQHIEMP